MATTADRSNLLKEIKEFAKTLDWQRFQESLEIMREKFNLESLACDFGGQNPTLHWKSSEDAISASWDPHIELVLYNWGTTSSECATLYIRVVSEG